LERAVDSVLVPPDSSQVIVNSRVLFLAVVIAGPDKTCVTSWFPLALISGHKDYTILLDLQFYSQTDSA
jgi:hypothetical protein